MVQNINTKFCRNGNDSAVLKSVRLILPRYKANEQLRSGVKNCI